MSLNFHICKMRTPSTYPAGELTQVMYLCEAPNTLLGTELGLHKWQLFLELLLIIVIINDNDSNKQRFSSPLEMVPEISSFVVHVSSCPPGRLRMGMVKQC